MLSLELMEIIYEYNQQSLNTVISYGMSIEVIGTLRNEKVPKPKQDNGTIL